MAGVMVPEPAKGNAAPIGVSGGSSVGAHDCAMTASKTAAAERPHSPLWQSPQLKEVIVAAALAGEITEQDAADLFVEYGLKEV